MSLRGEKLPLSEILTADPGDPRNRFDPTKIDKKILCINLSTSEVQERLNLNLRGSGNCLLLLDSLAR